jgi:hypothetical protein
MNAAVPNVTISAAIIAGADRIGQTACAGDFFAFSFTNRSSDLVRDSRKVFLARVLWLRPCLAPRDTDELYFYCAHVPLISPVHRVTFQ